MSNDLKNLAESIKAMRPMVPAKDFDISMQFYIDLGFQCKMLTDRLAELALGTCSFLLQDYYVGRWADNFVIHLSVSDPGSWWDYIVALDLEACYGVKARAPHLESWGVLVAWHRRSVRSPLENSRNSCAEVNFKPRKSDEKMFQESLRRVGY